MAESMTTLYSKSMDGQTVKIQWIILLVLPFTFYFSGLENGYIWDDDAYVTGNMLLRDIGGLSKIWKGQDVPQYYPITFSVFWIQEKLWGLDPLGYHVVNVFLHSFNSILFFYILRQIFPGIAFISALIFGIHPLHVESVAWITELKNVLSTCFLLISAVFFLNFENTSNKKSYLLSLAAFIFAILSKSIAVWFIAFLFLQKWNCPNKFRKRDLYQIVPFLFFGVLAGINTALWEKRVVGASGSAWNFTFIEHLLLAGKIICLDVYRFLFPSPLMFIYPRWKVIDTDLSQWLCVGAVISTSISLYVLRNRIGKLFFSGFLLFLAALFPALGFISVYPMRFSYIADHFQYQADLPLTALAVGAALFVIRNFPFFVIPKVIGYIGIIVLGLFYAYQVNAYLPAYASSKSLWLDTLQKNPKAWIAHNNLGFIAMAEGKTDLAILAFKKAIEVGPDQAEDSYYNLGVINENEGRLQEAYQLYQKSIQIIPSYANGHFGLANIYAKSGKNEEAIHHYQLANQFQHRFPEAMNNLGNVYLRIGKLDEAKKYFKAALQLRPNFPQAQASLNSIL
jgi:tetratricopeptide (TPR) repeat protein